MKVIEREMHELCVKWRREPPYNSIRFSKHSSATFNIHRSLTRHIIVKGILQSCLPRVYTAAPGLGHFYVLFACTSYACVGFVQVLQFPPTQSENTSGDSKSPLEVSEWCAFCNKLVICAGCIPASHPVMVENGWMDLVVTIYNPS